MTKLLRAVCLCAATLASASSSNANNDTWKIANAGIWGTGANWTDGSTPGISDSATFNAAGQYTVTFSANPTAIQALGVINANVTLTSSGGPRTLSVSSASGSKDATILGGSTLSLGTSGNPLHLQIEDELVVGNGINTGQVLVRFGSHLNAVLPGIGVAGNGTIVVDGAGSEFNALGFGDIHVGLNGHFGQIDYRNSAKGTLSNFDGINFGTVHFADSNVPGTTGILTVESGAAVTIFGHLRLASNAGDVGTATLNIQGNGSVVSQPVFAPTVGVVVGNATAGVAAINVGTTASGGILGTGTNGLTINSTGTVTIGSGGNTGMLDLNGPLTIDGGDLTVASGSSFQNFTQPVSISSGGSASIGANFQVQSGSLVSIISGGLLSVGQNLFVLDGTLAVDGAGSSVVANFAEWNPVVGNLHGVAAFRNGATGVFAAGMNVSADSDGVTSTLNIESSAHVTTGPLTVTDAPGGSATVTVRGPASTLTVNAGAPLTIDGSAVVNVLDDGTLAVGGVTTIGPAGKLNIAGGTANLQSIDNPGGGINFTAGSLSIVDDLIVGTGGVLGTNLTINGAQQLTLSGTTTVDASRTLALDGGTLNTGTLVVNGKFIFDSGTLGINQAGASINYPIVTGSPSAININANNVAIGSAASFMGFSHQGVLNVGGNTIALNSAGYARLGVLTTLAGGTIDAPNGIAFAAGSNFLGNGTVNARVAGEVGSVVEADGALTLGNDASPAGFNFGGELRTRQFSVTLNSSAQATLGNLTTLGSGATSGALNSANGLIVDFGDAITGYGTVNSNNTLANRAIINGVAQGISLAQRLTFTGYIKGTGTLNNVSFTGTFDPGLSTALLTVGNIAFAPSNTLIVELGGSSPGSGYDQIQSSGTLSLDGTLQVALINGFAPTLGNRFTVLTFGSRSGDFTSYTGLALGGHLALQHTLTSNSLILKAMPAVSGDINLDGVVDIFDINSVSANWNSAGPQGDANGDGIVNIFDINAISANWGAIDPGSAQAVPEPASIVLAYCGAGAMLVVARRRRIVSGRSRLPSGT